MWRVGEVRRGLRADQVAGYAARHQLLLGTPLEVHRVEFDASETFAEAQPRHGDRL